MAIISMDFGNIGRGSTFNFVDLNVPAKNNTTEPIYTKNAMYCQRASRSLSSGSTSVLTGYVLDGVHTELFKSFEKFFASYDPTTGALTFTNNYGSDYVGTPIYVFYEEMN